MVQTAYGGVPDVHGGPLADRLEALQHLDLRGVVGFHPASGTDRRFSFHRLVSLAGSHHPAPILPQSEDGIARGNERSRSTKIARFGGTVRTGRSLSSENPSAEFTGHEASNGRDFSTPGEAAAPTGVVELHVATGPLCV